MKRKCDKCRVVESRMSVVVHATVKCADCGKTYARCEKHGGVRGAMRSLKSHRGLHHPKKWGRNLA